MDNNKLEISYVSLGQLKPTPYNPRTANQYQLESLQRSLDEYGFVDPVIVNKRSGYIVGGHLRVLAARGLGLKEAPVVYVDLDDQHEKALNVSLNKIGGDFDTDLLAELISGLDAELLDLTGFSDDELSALQPDPIDEEEPADMDKPKVKRFTIDELRTLAKSIYPQQADTILDFLKIVDERSRD